MFYSPPLSFFSFREPHPFSSSGPFTCLLVTFISLPLFLVLSVLPFNTPLFSIFHSDVIFLSLFLSFISSCCCYAPEGVRAAGASRLTWKASPFYKGRPSLYTACTTYPPGKFWGQIEFLLTLPPTGSLGLQPRSLPGLHPNVATSDQKFKFY